METEIKLTYEELVADQAISGIKDLLSKIKELEEEIAARDTQIDELEGENSELEREIEAYRNKYDPYGLSNPFQI